jgi:hemerythrin-like metal-binding protein
VQEGAQAAAAGLAEVSKLIADIANLQHTVASAVEEQAATTSEMSRSIASSARAAEEMTGAMTHLAEAARVTSGGARTVKDLGEQISQPSANLRRLARRLGARQHESPKTGLDAAFFDKSIRAHIAWRTRLLIAIHGGEVPDRAKAADPSACALGQWLGKAGAQLGGLPDFAALDELHRTFHAQVGEALTAIAAGKAEEAQQLVISGPLSRTSRGTVALLQRLRPAGPGEDDSGLPAWSAALATGQPTVDSQHQELFRRVAALHAAMVAQPPDGPKVLGLLQYLVDYTKTHFAEEEQLMRQAGYPELARHQGVHQRLLEQVAALQREAAAGVKLEPYEVTEFLADWLRHHIGEVDQAYVPAMRAAGLIAAAPGALRAA